MDTESIKIIAPNYKYLIGQGSYGAVYKSTSKCIVCKTFKSFLNGVHEINVINNLKINSINTYNLNLVSIVCNNNCYSCDIDNIICYVANQREKIYINIDKYDYNLRQFIKIGLKYPIKLLFHDILKSYANMYQSFIIHGDIKLDNILVKKKNGLIFTYRPVLCDFSLSMFQLTNAIDNYKTQDLDYIQTINYRAPELLLKFTKFDYKIDIWSLGLIFYCLLNNIKDIFNSATTEKQINNICQFFGRTNVYEFCLDSSILSIKNYKNINTALYDNLICDEDAKDLLNQMLTLNPNYRIGLKSIFEHPYFVKSGIHYHIHEPNPINYIKNFYELHQIKYYCTFDRPKLFFKAYKFMIKFNISIKLLFQAIYISDYYCKFNNSIDNQKQLFCTILKLVCNNKISKKHIKQYIYPDFDILHAKKQYSQILIKIQFNLMIPTYADYIFLLYPKLANKTYSYYVASDLWILLLSLMCNVQHYKMDLEKCLETIYQLEICNNISNKLLINTIYSPTHTKYLQKNLRFELHPDKVML